MIIHERLLGYFWSGGYQIFLPAWNNISVMTMLKCVCNGSIACSNLWIWNGTSVTTGKLHKLYTVYTVYTQFIYSLYTVSQIDYIHLKKQQIVGFSVLIQHMLH